MKLKHDTWLEEIPALVFFLTFSILLIWISGIRTPWRDEVVTLFYLLPGKLEQGIKDDLHHPIMNLFDWLTFKLAGSSESIFRMYHGLFSIFGHICLYRGLKKRFAPVEALIIVALATTWIGGIYFYTSIRSNWALIVVPEIIFGFYLSFRNMKLVWIIPLLVFFSSIHLLNIIGIPIAFFLSCLWYEQKIPSKRTIIAVSSAILITILIYKFKYLYFGEPVFQNWSFGLNTNAIEENFLSFANYPSESKIYFYKEGFFLSSKHAERILFFGPFLFMAVAFLINFRHLKQKIIYAGTPLLFAFIIFVGLMVAELIGIKLFHYRNLHFAYFLFWLSLGLLLFTQPHFKRLSQAIAFYLISYNLIFMFNFCNYPQRGPIEKALALYTSELARQQDAVIIPCNDYILFKIYPPEDSRYIDYSCFEHNNPINRKYILTQLTWIGLTYWQVAQKKLLDYGYKEIETKKFAESEFLKIYSPPVPFKLKQ